MSIDGSLTRDEFNEREIEILRLIAEGRSNREIGDALFISVNTVRWYNKQIYSKLGTSNRTLAIGRARELGLLDNTAEIPILGIYDNLPQPPTAFVGREDELQMIQERLTSDDCRLLTLTGLGGIGKTRLAIEAAQRNLEHFAAGSLFISCTSLNHATDILPAILRAMNLTPADNGRFVQQLVEVLEDGKELLLVLDNLEHLGDASGIVRDLIQRIDGLTVLVTSRELLNLKEEYVIQVEGLDVVAASPDDVLNTSAVQLFIQSARQCNATFQIGQDTINAMVRICQMVEGMPLAIEIASAWTTILSLEEIITEIRRSLDFLQSQLPHVTSRHRSIRAVFECTWEMLGDDHHRAFANLSLFRGGFTREAAKAIAGADLHMLLALHNKSLVKVNADRKRYDLHELLRQFAEECLQQSPNASDIYAAHSRYFFDLLHRGAVALRNNDDQPLVESIEAEFDNIEAAWLYTLDNRDIALLASVVPDLYAVYTRFGRFKVGFRLVDEALMQAEANHDDDALHLLLREYRGRLASFLGDFEQAIGDLDTVLEASRKSGDKQQELAMLIELGKLCRRADKANRALRYLNTALKQARATHNLSMVAHALYHLGTVAWDEGDNRKAGRYYDEAVQICRNNELDDLAAAQVWHGLGESYMFGARPQEAFRAYRESLTIAERMNHVAMIAENQMMIGWALTGTNGGSEYPAARKWLNDALELSKATNIGWHKACASVGLGLVEGSCGDYQQGLWLLDYAVEVSQDISPIRLRSLAYGIRGKLFQDLNLFREAEADHIKALEIAQRVEYSFWMPHIQADIAINQIRQGQLNVEDDLHGAYDMAMTNGQETHVVHALGGLSELHLKRQQPLKAFKFIDQLAEFATARLFNEALAQAKQWRGIGMMLMEDFDTAESLLQQALDDANAIGRVRLIWENHSSLAQLYQVRGNEKQASEHEQAAQHIVSRIASNLEDDVLRSRFLSAANQMPVYLS